MRKRLFVVMCLACLGLHSCLTTVLTNPGEAQGRIQGYIDQYPELAENWVRWADDTMDDLTADDE